VKQYIHDLCVLLSRLLPFWLVSRGGVEPFDGDLDDYQRYLLDEGKRLREELKQAGKRGEAPEVKPEPAPVAAKKPVVSSGKIKALKQKLEKLDKSMAALQAEKAAFEARLGGALSVEEITETGKQLQHVIDELAVEEGMAGDVGGNCVAGGGERLKALNSTCAVVASAAKQSSLLLSEAY